MDTTQIQLKKDTRDALKWVKLLSASNDYDGAIRSLIEDYEHDVPDEPVTEANFREILSGDD